MCGLKITFQTTSNDLGGIDHRGYIDSRGHIDHRGYIDSRGYIDHYGCVGDVLPVVAASPSRGDIAILHGDCNPVRGCGK
jgi:hypothetical protein